MTYGEIRYRVMKEAPGVDLALVDGYLLDRYLSILDRLKWRRMSAETAFDTLAPWTQGYLELNQGSTFVLTVGAPLDPGYNGSMLFVDGREEYYEYTLNAPGSAIIDRGFAGPSGTYTYTLVQGIYQLPVDARIVTAVRMLGGGDLDRKTTGQLDESAPTRAARGVPRVWCPTFDANTTPPVLQIEIYPVPDQVYSFAVEYTVEAPALSGTSVALLPWLRPSALIAGAVSDALEHLDDLNRSDRQARKFETYLADMIRTECYNRGSQPLKASKWLTRHNVIRAMRSSTNRTGPRLP